MNAYEEYMREIVKPMRAELSTNGFTELMKEEEVTNFMENLSDTAFVVINSVCGCAAGLARPSAVQAVLEAEVKPAHAVTVFAGQDKEATAKLREYLAEFPPSSPSMAVFKGKEVVGFIPREQIEGSTPEDIKERILSIFKQM
ncbi:BrxA/BrxB family bacilliredoxin [Bacillus sp. RG28]|uniref:BrxA/BrxB family bacilliredoxin n=1 Tax=Gottfriedia endophytica TaxID=2820819 RepID=A0A940NHF4_9BACI|nr:BrxA/BrxB family bacilliredoxin [Gottfriedia endophytica]MBP0724092.1 BrxA/BrxB family bacilliredoxin [Gottfriedia endophytica]